MVWPAYERVNGVPQLRASMVTFADLLGTSDHAAADTAQATLAALDIALASARAESDIDDSQDYFVSSWFSDNVAMAAPIDAEQIEIQIGLMLLSTSWLQFLLARDGFFLRGGMQFGFQFADPAITFGPALVDAVRLEKETGVPRVALSALATSIVGIVAVDHFSLANNPFHYELAVDHEDGTTFVSYLDAVLGELDHPSDIPTVLATHRTAIMRQLEVHGRDEDQSILAKYAWVADYHNFVCGLYEDHSTIAGQPGRGFGRYEPPSSKANALEAASDLLDGLEQSG